MTAPGEIVPVDGAMVEVAAAVSGLAEVELNRSAPSIGQQVHSGDVLAVLSPATGESGYPHVRARAVRLEKEAARAERLYAAGAIATKRLEEARHDLEIAQAELAAMGGSTDGDYRYRLRSPISGIIAERRLTPGRRVEAGDTLFTVIDPHTVWLRVRMSAADVSGVKASTLATFKVEGDSRVHATSELVSIGSVIDPETRTLPVVFAIDNGEGTFKIGQMGRAFVPAGKPLQGVVIPTRAILDDGGIPVAYVQKAGETFERRILKLGGENGTRALVLAGIKAGEMVVTEGAYQVRLASLSNLPLSGGHAH